MQQGNQYINLDSNKMDAETTFLLKKSGVSSSSVSVQVNFSPIVYHTSDLQQPSSPSQTLQEHQFKTYPIYNSDQNYFTPSFILQVDQKKYDANLQIYESLFKTKVKQMDEQRVEMFVPKPSKSNSFCCVCKTVFEDYLTHVNLPMHKIFMYKSQFHDYIKELCTPYNIHKEEYVKKTKCPRKNKTKAIKKVQKQSDYKKLGFGACSTVINEPSFMNLNIQQKEQKVC